MKMTLKEVEASLIKHRGKIGAVANELDTDYHTVWRRIQGNPCLQECMEAINERLIDKAENKLEQHMANGDITALIFFLKTKGKKRGYVERNEVTGADGSNLIPSEIKITVVK